MSTLGNIILKATSRIELWNAILRAEQVETMLEIGVWKGDYAKGILEKCDFIKRYYMIDPWAPLPDWNKPFNDPSMQFDTIFEEAMTKTAFAASKIVVLRGRTKEVIDEIPDNSLDFAYIDGDHTLRGIVIDLIRLHPKIKQGGLIGGDDFINTLWQHDIRYEPTMVCPLSIYFAEAMNMPITALPFHQFLIERRDGSAFSFTDTTGNYGDVSLRTFQRQSMRSIIERKAKRLLSALGWRR
jgi:hypothetical protein